MENFVEGSALYGTIPSKQNYYSIEAFRQIEVYHLALNCMFFIENTNSYIKMNYSWEYLYVMYLHIGNIDGIKYGGVIYYVHTQTSI